MAGKTLWTSCDAELFYNPLGPRTQWTQAQAELFFNPSGSHVNWDSCSAELFYNPSGPSLPAVAWSSADAELFYNPAVDTGPPPPPGAPAVFQRPVAASFMPGPVAQQSSP